jgi:ribosomal protein S10
MTKQDITVIDDLMQKLIVKLQLKGIDTKKLEDVCYDILYNAECKAEGNEENE